MTLDELLKPANDYERAVAEHLKSRHDANLEKAIVDKGIKIAQVMDYVRNCAQKLAKGNCCVMMSDEDVYGLAVHYCLDGDTPVEYHGAVLSVHPTPQPHKPAKPKKEKKAKPKKEKKPPKEKEPVKETPKKDLSGQMTFDFWVEPAKEVKP